MRLAILSDIHGNLAALEAVLKAVAEFDTPDQLWLLGDLAAFGPRPAECIQRVQALSQDWQDQLSLIRGNTDRYLVTGERRAQPLPITAETFATLSEDWTARDLTLNWAVSQLSLMEFSFLRDLPETTLTLDVEGLGRVLGYHGLPGDDEGWFDPETTLDSAALTAAFDQLTGRLGIGGHTHRPMDRSWQDWRWLNAGSVGAPREGAGAEYLIVDFEHGQANVLPRRAAYPEHQAVADLNCRKPPAAEWMRRKMHFR